MASDRQRTAWVVAAPAGFGKTTFAAAVRRNAEERGDRVAWLSLDEEDDPLRFAATLMQALLQIGGEPQPVIQGVDPQAVLTHLAATEDPVWIILDDLHRASTETLHLVFKRLVEQAPETCRFVLATRTLNGLPLAKARMAGLVGVIDAEDLRLSPGEVAELGRLMGKAESQSVMALSEGWPVAASALLTTRCSWRNWAALEGSALFSYVEEEVISAMTGEQVDALTRCSLIEDVTADDVDRLIGARDGHLALTSALRDLDGLARRTIDPASGFRLNPVVAACLRHRLFATAGAKAEDYIERAVLRLTETRRTAEAGALAREAHDRTLLRRVLLEQTAVDLWQSGVEGMSRILDLADEDMRLSAPQLLLMSMIVDMKEGRIGEAERKMALAAERWSRSHPPEHLDVLRIGLVVYGCKPFDDSEQARLARLLSFESSDANWLVIAQSAASILYLQQGSLDLATTMAVAAMNSVKHEDLPYEVLFLNYHLSAIAAASGDTKRARELLRNGRLILRTRFARDEGAEIIAAVQSAELDYELGRLATARARVRMIDARLHRMEGWLDVYASAFATSARVLQHDLGLAAAIEHLQANAQSLRRRELGRVADHLDVLATLMRACAALNGRGDDMAVQAPTDAGWESEGWREREATSLARAAALLLEADAAGALAELDRLTGFAHGAGIKRTELRAQLLTCEAADRLGEEDLAQAAFETALQIGLATGFRRSFLDYGGHSVCDRLQAIALTNSAAGRFAQSVLGSADPGHAGSDVRLTRREQEVLHAVEKGGSDKIIARRLCVSEHAVRFHLKNIFHKLKAHSRSEAVQAGHRLGVLDLLDPVGATSTDPPTALPN